MSFNPSDVQSHLRGVAYPATKDDLISTAERNGAPDDVIDMLQTMDGEQFGGPDEVMEALAGR